MADIKTMTQEITELNIDVEESIGGVDEKLLIILNKIIEKLDEVVTKINE